MAEFIISRTSDGWWRLPPESVVEGGKLVDNVQPWWREERRGYVATLTTLEELLALVGEHGKVVVHPQGRCEDYPDLYEIEIYDRYRE